MKPHLKEGYQGAEHLNPELKLDGEHYYVVVKEGGKEVERWLSNNMEGHKFYWQCRCQHAHYRWCTANNLRKAADLLCIYCHARSAAWRRAHRFIVVACEHAFVRCVKEAGWQSDVTWQVHLPGWGGCFDFVHLPSMTIFQVDGASHFTAKSASSIYSKLTSDIECCKWAVQHERRLVRIHHKCPNMLEIMKAAVELQQTTFVMLSTEFRTVHVRSRCSSTQYVEKVAEQLAPVAQQAVSDLPYILFV